MVPNAHGIVLTAINALGIEEQPIGSNDGKQLRALLSDTNFKPGDPWCMFFAVHCVQVGYGAGVPIPAWISKSGSCEQAMSEANAAGKLSDYPATGCIFLLLNESGWAHHAGIVQSVDEAGGTIATVEGNTNDNGSPEGFGVFSHNRKIAGLKFIIW